MTFNHLDYCNKRHRFDEDCNDVRMHLRYNSVPPGMEWGLRSGKENTKAVSDGPLVTDTHLFYCDTVHDETECCNVNKIVPEDVAEEPIPIVKVCKYGHRTVEECFSYSQNTLGKQCVELAQPEEPTEGPESVETEVFTLAQVALLLEYGGFLQSFDLGDMERTKLALAMLGDPLIKSAVYVLGKGPM